RPSPPLLAIWFPDVVPSTNEPSTNLRRRLLRDMPKSWINCKLNVSVLSSSICPCGTSTFVPQDTESIKSMTTGTSEARCAVPVLPLGLVSLKSLSPRKGRSVSKPFWLTPWVAPFIARRYIKKSLRKLLPTLRKSRYKPDIVVFVPISGWNGDSTLEPSANKPYSKAGELLIKMAAPVKPCCQLIQLTSLVSSPSTHPPVGKPGMVGTLAPVSATVKSVQMQHEALRKALPGDSVGFNIKNLFLVATKSKSDPPMETAGFTTRVIFVNLPGKVGAGVPVQDCHTAADFVIVKSMCFLYNQIKQKSTQNNP
ncbi:Elongation factor 1-alpha 1, partial [Galemys pyrenaicus]